MAKSLKYVQQDFLGWLSAAVAALDSVATRCAAALVKPRALRQPPRARHRKAPPRKRLPAVLLTPVVLMLVSVASWVVLAR
jgi:hypothetical protein